MHPRHGAGKVVARGSRRVLGSARDYLEIEMAYASLRILVPCDATAEVGLRAVAGPRGLQRIVDVLEAASEPELAAENWSDRKRRNLARLKDGDVLGLAAVIRDLVRRGEDGNLLPSERQLLDRSRPVLASELRYALGVGAEQADAYIDEHITAMAKANVAGDPAGSGDLEAAHSAEL
jgi:RNA polymerase-interacting CarD/CdnL/TRCF family regulator